MIYSILRILVATGAIVLSARLSFDLNIAQYDIPITGQTLAVLCIALLLPTWEAAIAVAAYLGLGAVGMPVFANGNTGISYLIGNNAGYLWGFLLATLFVSSTRGYKDEKSLAHILQQQMIGTLIILICGVVVLSLFIGVPSAIQYGFIPFLMGAVVKIIAGTAIVYGIKKML